MKILVTGSHGFIGMHTVATLINSGHRVFGWDRKVGKPLKKITIKDLVGIDVVIHLAATISVPHSFENPEAYFVNNTDTTLHLARLAAKAGVKKFIFASSSSVYGKPLSPYGASKLSAEHALDHLKDKMQIYILRFFNVYGPHQNPETPGVITKLIKAIKDGKKFKLNGDGTQTRDFTYVRDVASAIEYFVENNTTVNEPIDIASGKPISLIELIAMLTDISGKPVDYSTGPEIPEIKNSKSEQKQLINFVKFTPIEKGLRQTYEKIN